MTFIVYSGVECGTAHELRTRLHLGSPSGVEGLIMSGQPHEEVRCAPEDLGLAADLLSFLARCRRLIDTGDVQPKEFHPGSIALREMGVGGVCNYGCGLFGGKVHRIDSRNVPGRSPYTDCPYAWVELPSTRCV